MSFTVQIHKEFFQKLFNEPQPYEPEVDEYLVPEIEPYLAGESSELEYVLFTELGGIYFLDENNEIIPGTCETCDWDTMLKTGTKQWIEFYMSEIKK